MNEESYAFLKELTDTPGPSGFETGVLNVWKTYVQKHLKEEIVTDKYGSMISVINPNGQNKIMLCAHADEIGFMVSYISDEGFIYVKEVGGPDYSVLLGQKVVIYGKNGPIFGVFGKKPIHFEEDEEGTEFGDMFIDIGAKNKKSVLKDVSVGDFVVSYNVFARIHNGRISARGLDNKAGLLCVAETMIKLQQLKLNNIIFGVASVHEELGCFGAKMLADNLKPDVAIIIDLTHATDYPGVSKERFGDIRLGSGPVVSFGAIPHPIIRDKLIKSAKALKIPIQYEAEPNETGTDADVVFSSGSGILTGLVNIPSRYVHTPVEVVDSKDLDNTIKLLVKFCESY